MSKADELKRDQQALLDELAKAGAAIHNPKKILCPFHNDTRPSSGLYEKNSGWYFKCQSCGWHGSVIDVMAHNQKCQPVDMLRKLADEQKRDRVPPPPPKPARSWPTLKDLANEIQPAFVHQYAINGEVRFAVLRIEREGQRKQFIQAACHGDKWMMKAPEGKLPLYMHDLFDRSDTIYVCEGEKACRAAYNMGLAPTTSPGGAGKAEYADWTPLAGKKIVLWPDNDDAGKDHMRTVRRIVEAMGCPVSEIDPAMLQLPEKGDAADFEAMHADLDNHAKQALIQQATQDRGGAAEVQKLLLDTIEGRRVNVAWPHEKLSKLTRSLLPETITLICGDPGDGKSFFLTQALAHWYKNGIDARCMMLEGRRDFHLLRVLCQLADNSRINDADWLMYNDEEAMRKWDDCRVALDDMGQRITCVERMPTLKDVAEWAEQQAMQGARIVCVDPITKADAGEKRFTADQDFMHRMDQVACKYQCSIVLVTHPKAGSKGMRTMENCAGGTAFERFAHTMLWLEKHEKKAWSWSRAGAVTGTEKNPCLHSKKQTEPCYCSRPATEKEQDSRLRWTSRTDWYSRN